MNVRSTIKVGAAIAAVAATATLTPTFASASPSATVASAHASHRAGVAGVQAAKVTKLSAVYQGKVVNQDMVLGPQSSPTTLTQTAPLPAGTYLVTATVAAVISSHDQIVCAAYPGGGNDGVFGTAGNPGTGGIYGTATMTDTVTVTAGQRIPVVCNSFNYGLGTYAGSAVVEAVPVAAVR
ncbi:exported hypothetical protein [Nostocoides japonicum T1-X7]|uniref:Uncharacterized protein n=1 Tax=Nostocoides japonicum T1-X7 TaxID=1194083 RepID=A0A077M2N1_9MICO|nr:hypothetical protein [Tetrasphaera japonica]CCH78499.1 exported hypothetical protein [Tetrasphaera japonica T1-X7]